VSAGSGELGPGPGQLFIGGRWEAATGGATQPVLNPATGATLTSVAAPGAADVDRAVRAARAAFDGGGWSGLRPRERGRVLLRAAELLGQRAEEFARLESLDTGKPILFTRTVDVPAVIDTFEYYASLAAGIDGAVRDTAGPALAYTRREPVGVVGAITPVSLPLILSATKIAPALAAGSTIVHKPAPDAPLSALRLAGLLAEAGLPGGVYNLVTGDSAAGQALTGHPLVDKIAFTGSSATGRAVARLAARTLKPVTVELGGKGANLIFADADLEAAVNTAISAFVFNTGQFCMSGSRLLVERPVCETVIDAVAAALPEVRVGDPLAEGTIIGPMTGPAHLARVQSYLDRATAAGLRRHDGARVPGPGGFYVSPALLAGAGQDSPFVQEEIFGPVVTAQPFETEAEAVALANGTAYGLAAGLQTGSVARAHRVAAALRAGIVWVNGWSLLDPAMPFGGAGGQSGYGRENGPEGLDAYLRTKSVVVSLAGAELAGA
jgi:acyl-CoA reductase-like NAD-dependent aldehyde dehydrogenase